MITAPVTHATSRPRAGSRPRDAPPARRLRAHGGAAPLMTSPDAAAVNRAFPRYPVTVFDKGWTYGVWYCGTGWAKVDLHGQYPPSFLSRALALFPDAVDILHCPSGTVTGPGVTVDAVADEVRHPQIVASADAIPLPDESFDLILSDPPYTDADSAVYGCGHFPLRGFMGEAHRLLRPGGCLGMLHLYYPSYRRRDWHLVGLVAVVTGFQRATRIFSVLQKDHQGRLSL
jgi:SAM-dependent methyltransferase